MLLHFTFFLKFRVLYLLLFFTNFVDRKYTKYCLVTNCNNFVITPVKYKLVNSFIWVHVKNNIKICKHLICFFF